MSSVWDYFIRIYIFSFYELLNINIELEFQRITPKANPKTVFLESNADSFIQFGWFGPSSVNEAVYFSRFLFLFLLAIFYIHVVNTTNCSVGQHKENEQKKFQEKISLKVNDEILN